MRITSLAATTTQRLTQGFAAEAAISVLYSWAGSAGLCNGGYEFDPSFRLGTIHYSDGTILCTCYEVVSIDGVDSLDSVVSATFFAFAFLIMTPVSLLLVSRATLGLLSPLDPALDDVDGGAIGNAGRLGGFSVFRC